MRGNLSADKDLFAKLSQIGSGINDNVSRLHLDTARAKLLVIISPMAVEVQLDANLPMGAPHANSISSLPLYALAATPDSKPRSCKLDSRRERRRALLLFRRRRAASFRHLRVEQHAPEQP